MMQVDRMVQYREDYFEDCKALIESNYPYRNHVNKFIEYLSLPEVHLADTPREISKETVKKCIGYYHQKGEINSRKTMESHLESIKSFYDYLSRTGKWVDIFSDLDYSDFKDTIVKMYGLSEPIERGFFKCSDIQKILITLDDVIDSFEISSAGIRDEERYLQRIILRLFIKLTLIAPAKRNVITAIIRADIGNDFKKLRINDVEMNIPCGLSRDLKSAIRYAEKKNGSVIKENDNIFEFIYRYKGKFKGESLNAWFFNMNQDFDIIKGGKSKKSLAVEPIRNTAIKMMVNNMVNPILISRVSGIKLSIIEATYYPQTWRAEYNEDLNKSINRAIAQNDYYCYI
ncbi:MAG: hypothetical protein Q4F83_10405 [Eubacteriales bacterium]|nr:hypothetical protein [Eubacteriales bacterium]